MSGGAVSNTGNKFTMTGFATCFGATISGGILTFASTDNPVYLQAAGYLSRVAIAAGGAGGIPRDTFIIEHIDDTHWRTNIASLSISSTTIYVLPDYRPGYEFDSNPRPMRSIGLCPLGQLWI